ncbi:hypothetical protein HUB97_13945 [Halorubraceae archaeon YAN]|nr:hypothetical protein [Halorubraceae archaeon YAN]
MKKNNNHVRHADVSINHLGSNQKETISTQKIKKEQAKNSVDAASDEARGRTILFNTLPSKNDNPELHLHLNNFLANKNHGDQLPSDEVTDQKILNLQDFYYGELDIDPTDFSIREKYVRLLYFYFARGLGVNETIRYLREHPDLFGSIGVQKTINAEMLSRKKNKVTPEEKNKIEHAAKHAVGSIHRNGWSSEHFVETHGLRLDDTDFTKTERPIEQEALKNIVQEYIDTVICSTLTFNRASNSSKEFKHIIGTLICTALYNSAPDKIKDTIDYQHDRSKIPTGGHIYDLIKSLDWGPIDPEQKTLSGEAVEHKAYPTELIEQADQAFKESIKFANKYGATKEKHHLSCDGTVIESTAGYEGETENDPRIDNKKSKFDTSESKSGWGYNVVGTTGKGLNLVTNIRPVLYNTSYLSEISIEQLKHFETIPNIERGTIVFDRQYYRGELVEGLRNMKRTSTTNNESIDWIIGAKRSKKSEQRINSDLNNKIQMSRLDFADVEKDVWLLAYPLTDNTDSDENSIDTSSKQLSIEGDESRSQSRKPIASNPKRSSKSHLLLITDNKLSENEVHKAFALYRKRGGIEAVIRGVKNNMPEGQPKDAACRYYFMILGGLLYNLRQIVNGAILDEGVDLKTNSTQILNVAANCCFDDE